MDLPESDLHELTELGRRSRRSRASLIREAVAPISRVAGKGTREFLNWFELVPIDHGIADRAVELRKTHRIKLPDAIVWASAQVHAMLLVIRDAEGLPGGDSGVRLPYRL